MPAATKDLPRRVRLELLSPAEHMIRAAMVIVEHMPAHQDLTEAIVLLVQALGKVADFVDAHGLPDPPATPSP